MRATFFAFMTAALVVLTGAAFADGHAVTQSEMDAAEACPRTSSGSDRLVCACNAGQNTGSIWGDGPYTGDSATCAAATHAGALEAGVGVVVLIPMGRQDEFPASTENGVTSSSWGSWDRSFDVVRAQVQAGQPVAVEFSAAALAKARSCPATIGSETQVLCACPADAPARSVWGSGPYTGDSNLCTAAIHAGIIGQGGGLIAATAVDGQDVYTGSDANGVMTRDWGRYGTSVAISAAIEEGTAIASTDIAACGVLPAGLDRYSCSCPADDGTRAAIYGAGPYTADSDICTAARHDGAVAREGGIVTVLRIGGLEAYGRTDRNGITPNSWGRYASSIVFDRNTGQ